jgi:hypothetical protein
MNFRMKSWCKTWLTNCQKVFVFSPGYTRNNASSETTPFLSENLTAYENNPQELIWNKQKTKSYLGLSPDDSAVIGSDDHIDLKQQMAFFQRSIISQTFCSHCIIQINVNLHPLCIYEKMKIEWNKF